MRTTRIIILLATLLLPGVVLAPVWRLAGLGAGEDDVLYYYPSRALFHELIRAGQWPWLDPWTGLGRPYLADPQSAVWYPFTWLFALLPPVWSYPLHLWAHYSIALWGMYRLTRALRLERRAALFGGIAFAFCGFLLAHRAHFAMQAAAAWTPWVFWRLRRYVKRGRAERLFSAALVAALQCLAGHVQIAALTALGSLVYLLAEAGLSARSAGRWLAGWLGAAGLFAAQWLPSLLYVRHCTRFDRNYAGFVENSWYPSSALGWLLPMLFGQRTPNFFDQPYWGPSHQVEQFSYAGILPLVLAALALRGGWPAAAQRRGWGALVLFALLTALGRFGPVCPLLYWLPGASLFRVPARALLLFNLGLAVLAAGVVHDLGAAHSPARVRLRAAAVRWTRRPLSTALLLVALPAGAVALVTPLLDHRARQAALAALAPWSPAVWVPLLTALSSLLLLAVVVRRWRRPAALWLLSVLTVADLAVIGWTLDAPAGARGPADLLAPDGRQAWLKHVRAAPHRLWVVTARRDRRTPGEYVDPVRKGVANTNALVHVASLVHYGPLQPRSVVRQFGFRPWGETERAARLLADTSWMRRFDVGWVLLCEPSWPAPAGCDLVATTPDGMRLYRNPAACGQVLFADPTQPGAVRSTLVAACRLKARVDSWPTPAGAPVRLVVSRLALPGWQAKVNGRPVTFQQAAAPLLAIDLPPGRALELECAFSPPGLRAGVAVSALSLLALLLAVALRLPA